ncbi:hypothetical protein ABTE96_22555, partial [Acinetobacter baumannii]
HRAVFACSLVIRQPDRELARFRVQPCSGPLWFHTCAKHQVGLSTKFAKSVFGMASNRWFE